MIEMAGLPFQEFQADVQLLKFMFRFEILEILEMGARPVQESQGFQEFQECREMSGGCPARMF